MVLGMLEKAGCCALDFVIPLLKAGVIMIWSVPEEVEVLEKEREKLGVRIREADRSAAAAEDDDIRDRMRSTATKLRIIEFRIEDVLDEWNSCLQHEKASGRENIKAVDGWHSWLPCDHGCVASPCEDANLVNIMCSVRLRIALKIRKIKSDIGEIDENDSTPSPEQDRSSSTKDAAVAWKNLQRKQYEGHSLIVGLESPCEKLTDWLEDGRAECSVMVVVGMAGQGKTTLVKQIFDNNEVIGKFNCSAWINVSDFDDPKEFLKFMLEEFYQEPDQSPPYGYLEMGLESLKKEVKKYLRKKRYVFFFDDVWNTNFWQEIEHTVSNNENGSRIIITTRNKEVWYSCEKSTVVDCRMHEMQPLTDNESLKLFCQTAFKVDTCPKRFVKLSNEIVEGFEGLPLGIVAIGKHVYRDRTNISKWKSIIREAGIAEILCLSYDNLPRHLKPCLSYFGIYPQGYAVKTKRLIQQWIAEGFVKSDKGGKTFEEVAKDYLAILIHRNLVQVSTFTIDGKPKSCRVHYLVHDMILRKFEDLSFCRCVNENDRSDVDGITRRLSIATKSREELHGFFDNLLLDGIESSFIRSLHFFTEQKLPESFVRRIPAKDKPLKVLDFENSPLSYVVENLGNLIHLKYLSFRKTEIESLPRSIGKLQNLETLDLRQTRVNEIPEEVSKLRKLQRLLGDEMSLIQMKDGIKDMTSLQTLRDVKLDDQVGLIEKELGKLWQITDLGLTNVTQEHESALCSAINKTVQLEKLCIVAKSVIDLQDLKNASKLQKLRLQGKLRKFPAWVPDLDHLVKLVLSGSQLTEDPLKSLKDIPGLLFLSITNEAYLGESLQFQDGDFEVLEELELESLYTVSSISIHSNAMSSLKKLQLRDIPQLKRVPSCIQHLKKLKDLNIKDMPTDFEQSICPDGVQKHQIVEHVPRVRINGELV